MTDLLDEVQEDLKEEQYSRVVSKLTRIFLVLAVLALVFTSIYSWKESASNKLQQQLSISFNSAVSSIEQNKLDDALLYLDQVILHSHQQYAALAYLQKSAVLVKQNKYEEAQNTLLEITKHKHFDLAFRELAQVIYLGNQLQMNQDLNQESSEILARLTKDNKPWQLSALQLKALYDLKQNRIDDAKITLNEIIGSKQASKYSQDAALSILSVISRSK